MAHHFQSESKTIDDLFEGTLKPRLEVPEFQRGYSWTKKHVDAFWKDLTNFLEEKKSGVATKYFLGPIVILEREQDNALEILDGQQRLATVTILFAAMRNAAKEIGTVEFDQLANGLHSGFIAKIDAGDHLGFSLVLGDLDRDYFRDTIQEFPAKSAKATIKSHRNIATAYRAISDSMKTAIAGLSAPKKMAWLKELRNAVRAHLVMTYIPVANQREAFQIFETLNDRGLRLSVPDLLLNYLMKMSDEKDRPDIRSYWNQMTTRMGQRSIGQFLRHLWVSQFGDLKKQDLFTALKQHIEAVGAVSREFAKQSANQCTKYCALMDGDKTLPEGAPSHVRNLPSGRFPAIRRCLFLLSALDSISDAGFVKLTKWLLVFVVRHSIVAGMDAAELESLFFSLAKDLRNKMADEAIEKDKREGQCLKFIKEELMKKNPSEDKIMSSVEGLELSSREGHLYLDQNCQRNGFKDKRMGVREANLEHIFPENPSEEWANKEELEPFLWNIGNLTMLGTRLNDDSENSGFDVKKADYASKSEIEMAKKIAKEHSKWDADEVKKRAMSLGKWIEQIWNLQNPSRV